MPRLGGVAKAKRKQRLKVYRTPIGFHDAYVAAPSQKAALEAWGSDTNLFASGAAEEVTDGELTKEPLAKPGVVLRRMRGGKAEQMEAISKETRSADRPVKTAAVGSDGRVEKRKKPSRRDLDEAEEALEELERAQRDEAATLERKEKELERQRREMERRHARETREMAKKVRRAREDHEAAIEEWRAA